MLQCTLSIMCDLTAKHALLFKSDFQKVMDMHLAIAAMPTCTLECRRVAMEVGSPIVASTSTLVDSVGVKSMCVCCTHAMLGTFFLDRTSVCHGQFGPVDCGCVMFRIPHTGLSCVCMYALSPLPPSLLPPPSLPPSKTSSPPPPAFLAAMVLCHFLYGDVDCSRW
jgi:hypothetical protein